jgi:hypothetical protein
MAYIWSKVSSEAFLATTISTAVNLRLRLSVKPATLFYTTALVVSVVLLSSAKYISLWSVIPFQVAY